MFIIIAALMILLWYSWGHIPVQYINKTISALSPAMGSWSNIADTGKKLEALNIFISILAFLGLLLTINLQYQDLQTTKKELKMTNLEFARQTIESSLFQYYQHMNSVAPKRSHRLAKQILDEVGKFDDLCKRMSKHPHLLTSPRHLNKLKASVNFIRAGLKEYSTMRRIFASWCGWVSNQQHLKYCADGKEKAVKEYIHRLWCMFNQDIRRILFLQNAFFLEGRKEEWDFHFQLTKHTKCIRKFVEHYDIVSVNLLLIMLHPDGASPNYPISNPDFSDSIRQVYHYNQRPYLFDSATPAPPTRTSTPTKKTLFLPELTTNPHYSILLGVSIGCLLSFIIYLVFKQN